MPLPQAHPSTSPFSSALQDALGRPLQDLRISLTDRCNFRCTYCMPREVFGPQHAFLPPKSLLSLDEIHRIARIFVAAGVQKLRLTGGEPLLRPGLPELIAQLSTIPGVQDLALTTNGAALPKLAPALRRAGLQRLTVSLDALDPDTFARMSDAPIPVQTVLDGIQSARAAGFSPIRLNMVVQRGINQHQILPMAEAFAKPGFILRFIEYMDVGHTNGWRFEHVVPASEILATLRSRFSLEPLPPRTPGETARRYHLPETDGEIGVIASVTAPFCRNCSRARISAEGRLHTCLFGEAGLDLRQLLRSGVSDESLLEAIRAAWNQRADRYSELRSAQPATARKTEMSVLGG